MEKIDTLLLQIMELSIDGIFIENNRGDIIVCNKKALEIFGYTMEEMLKLNISDLVPKYSDFIKPKYTKEDLFEDKYVERENVKKDGTIFPTEVNSHLIVLNGEEYLVAFVRDITEEKKTKELLYKLSTFDDLTGVYNRRAFFDVLDNIDYDYSLCMLDLDDFKKTNDTYGHHAGDAVLREFGKLMLDEKLMAARIGGEEFLILAPVNKSEMNNVIRKLLCKANQMLPEYGGIRFSAGIAESNEACIDKLLMLVDKRVYKVKDSGKNNICLN